MKTILGWSGVIICTVTSSFWVFWGAIEGFHEGWYNKGISGNLFSVLLYLLPGIGIAALGWVSIRSPKIGAFVFVLAGVLISVWVLRGNFRITAQNWCIPLCFTLIPVALGLLFLVGNPQPRRYAAWVVVGFPALMMLVSGAPPAWRVITRRSAHDLGPQIIETDGVALEWAGAGPGWERSGSVSWWEATRRSAHLSRDGKTLMDAPQNIWRLPSVDETVRSMAVHGRNCRGRWDAGLRKAVFERPPDKEPPLWDTNSSVTYYWTSIEEDHTRAWWVVYDGGVFLKRKANAPGNVGFRAVRELPARTGE